MMRARFNAGRVLLVQRNGTIASPLAPAVTGATSGLFAMTAGSIVLPAGFISDNATLCVRARVKRTGANATGQFDAYLGTAGTSSDSLLGRVQSTATDGHVASLDSMGFFTTSTTAFLANGTAVPQSSTGGGTFVDRSTNVNRLAAMTLSLGMSSMNASDSYSLVHVAVWLEQS